MLSLACTEQVLIHSGLTDDASTSASGGDSTSGQGTSASSESSSDGATGDSSSTDSSSGSSSGDSATSSDSGGDSSSSATSGGDDSVEDFERRVLVTLDGEPTAGIIIKQGGVAETYITGEDGGVVVTVRAIEGDHVLHASHPEARIGYTFVEADDDGDTVIDLVRFGTADNEEYEFFPPGTPVDVLFCAHCHQTINAAWYDSPHRSSASNPAVQDLYAGVVSAITDEGTCVAVGGNWWLGLQPGTGESVARCYLGAGTLPDLNPGCGDTSSCDDVAESFGECADCHAPAINGKLGGRDLLEARGSAEFDGGVHCDLCHKTESVDLDAPPGVGGRLVVRRPTEFLGVPGEPWKPLSFGPYRDVSNIKMGAVYRPHFRSAEFCAACHEHDAAVEPAWGSIDTQRWPDGRLPLQSTYEEWLAGPMNPTATCVECHMPPDGSVLNAADLQNADESLGEPGMIWGWARPYGQMRQHSWPGPRAIESGMLERTATVRVQKTVVGDEVEASVTVRNSGAGHAIPTGEAMRSIVLLVQATCDDTILPAIDGSVVPDFGGYLDRKAAPEDWNTWPGASVGDVVRVVARPGGWIDYAGFGPFGDGTFTAEEKGMPREVVVGESTIVAVDGDTVTFDTPLPTGDVAYRGEAIGKLADLDGPASAVAGMSGFGFARVLTADDGSIQVPHFRAVDVASDNRIAPQATWTSEHRFRTTCDDPEVRAVLLYRPYPLALARERQWALDNRIMVEVWK